MSGFDDQDLIDRLQSGIAECQSGVAAPDGIADRARRTARRRAATKMVAGGVPVVAAAGVATALATGATPSSSGGAGSGSGGSIGHDTAYVLRHVKARLAQDRASDHVEHTYGYRSGRIDPDGSLSDLGPSDGHGWVYTAPDGTITQTNVGTDSAGDPSGVTGHGVTHPVVHGSQRLTLTLVNARAHTYSDHVEVHSGVSPTPGRGPEVGLGSSAPEVQQALQDGELSQRGTTTIAGRPAIALATRMSSSTPQASSYHLTLYVDAETYRPLRLVSRTDGSPTIEVDDYEPATPANVARATGFSVPAGYTKVADAG